MTPSERVAHIFNEAVGRDLSSWERHQFLPSIKERSSLSKNQENILRDIERKLFGCHWGSPSEGGVPS
jgi:hypothetical protein